MLESSSEQDTVTRGKESGEEADSEQINREYDGQNEKCREKSRGGGWDGRVVIAGGGWGGRCWKEGLFLELWVLLVTHPNIILTPSLSLRDTRPPCGVVTWTPPPTPLAPHPLTPRLTSLPPKSLSRLSPSSNAALPPPKGPSPWWLPGQILQFIEDLLPVLPPP